MKSFLFLSVDEVISLHKKVMMRFGGGGYAIRDKALLESAIEHPKIILFGQSMYQDIFQISAVYMVHIIKNHPFVDGNKRIGLLVALTFLERNGYMIKVDNDELYVLTINVAESKITKEELTLFFKNHSMTVH